MVGRDDKDGALARSVPETMAENPQNQRRQVSVVNAQIKKIHLKKVFRGLNEVKKKKKVKEGAD